MKIKQLQCDLVLTDNASNPNPNLPPKTVRLEIDPRGIFLESIGTGKTTSEVFLELRNGALAIHVWDAKSYQRTDGQTIILEKP